MQILEDPGRLTGDSLEALLGCAEMVLGECIPDEIAAFVSAANPNLPKGTVYGLLLTHGQQHIMSIDATTKKDWGHEADMWDPMVKHIYAISDALADGIAKQFPDKIL
jgi:hypothetical protein